MPYKTFFTILIILFFTVNTQTQFKIKAKDKFTQAQQKANMLAPDAMLYAITSSAALDSSGKDLAWLYNYYSAQLDTGIMVTTTFLGALTATLAPSLPGISIRLLTDIFVNSDVALAAAEDAGGRLFRYAHPSATIFATVYKIPAMPASTKPYWTVIYSDSTDLRIYLIDGITGQIITLSAEPVSNKIPESYSLNQNYPNPFNPSTKIRFSIPKNNNEFSYLIIYNNIGQQVSTLLNEKLKAGEYEVEWNAAGFSTGVYYYKLISGNFIETKKMILVK